MWREVTLAVVMLGAGAAHAACGVSAVSAVAFGTYDPFISSATDSTGTVTVSCTGLAGLISVDVSAGSSGNMSARTLKYGTNTLSYQLYFDLLRTQVMGDGTNGTLHYSSVLVALGAPVTFTFYGRVTARQAVAPGPYADTLVVTVSY